ncbi:MAG: hypothetical protein QNI90_09895 [Dinoroseobacter sp.]|nr:hypothetical protein [Dinoroseobacter sp.]
MEHGRFIAAEPGELEQFSEPWDLLIDSPGRSEPCALLEYLAAPGLTVMRETYLRPARLIGMPPPNELVLGIPVGRNRGSTSYGQEIVSNQIHCLAGTAMEARYECDQEVLAVHLDLAQDFDGLLGLAIDRLVSSHSSLAVGDAGPETSHLVDCLQQVFTQTAQRKGIREVHASSADLKTIMAAITAAVLPERLDGIEGKKPSQARAVATALSFCAPLPIAARLQISVREPGSTNARLNAESGRNLAALSFSFFRNGDCTGRARVWCFQGRMTRPSAGLPRRLGSMTLAGLLHSIRPLSVNIPLPRWRQPLRPVYRGLWQKRRGQDQALRVIGVFLRWKKNRSGK